MGEPLKLLGAQSKVAAWFAYLSLVTGATKKQIYRFHREPPTTKQEFTLFFQELLGIVESLDDIQLTAQQGLEVAKDNGMISQTTDPLAALKEIRDWLTAVIEEHEQI